MPRADGFFKLLEKISDNVYKITLSGEYDVLTTFIAED